MYCRWDWQLWRQRLSGGMKNSILSSLLKRERYDLSARKEIFVLKITDVQKFYEHIQGRSSDFPHDPTVLTWLSEFPSDWTGSRKNVRPQNLAC
jgi:hypothetical protein